MNPAIYQAHRDTVLSSRALIVEGRLQKEGYHLSIKVAHPEALSVVGSIASHDFH